MRKFDLLFYQCILLSRIAKSCAVNHSLPLCCNTELCHSIHTTAKLTLDCTVVTTVDLIQIYVILYVLVIF
jgi:hypothetical protein